MNLHRNERWFRGFKDMCCASNIETYRLAIVGAGYIPMAIPLCCLTTISPKRIQLLFVTSEIALVMAVGFR